ncbi:MAG: SOS response-associated peptidase [Synechococcaceae cyanobacterium]|nr:SOS response-associated peptidase [Synechococcaceae cyanobacterium]
MSFSLLPPMCGRYSLTSPLDQLLSRLQGPLPEGLAAHYAPRPQVRPGEPVLLQRQEHGQLATGLALWGFLPDWCRDPGGRRRPINARSESVAARPFFRSAWRHRRALLPADGFYEWQDRRDPGSGQLRKQPWLFRRRDRAPFWLGGLWDRWLGADGSELETCVILTTRPNDLLARVHDRMPVVIPEGLEQAWLEPQDGPSLRALEPLLEPWDPAAWEAVRLPAPAGASGARPPGAPPRSQQGELPLLPVPPSPVR